MKGTRRDILRWCAGMPVLALAGSALAAAAESGVQVTGQSEPHHQPFDRAIKQFMEAQEVTAGQLAIHTQGKVVLNHGYTNASSKRPPQM
jgi:CubicO group peptidase (beta-lactamase class C family)